MMRQTMNEYESYDDDDWRKVQSSERRIGAQKREMIEVLLNRSLANIIYY